MARLSTYAIDGTPVSSDKLIGTDDSGVATKNYPLGTVAAWLKESGATAILGQNNFIFQTEVDPQVGRLPGTFSLPVVGGDGTPFSDITTLKFSITSSAGQYVVDYIASTVGSKVILGQLDDLNAFGVYALESFTQDPEAPTFYNAVLSLASGNGSLISAKSYGFATYSSSATSGGTWGGITGTITNQTDLVDYIDAEIAAIPTPPTPTLQSVTDAGAITTNDITTGSVTSNGNFLITGNDSTVQLRGSSVDFNIQTTAADNVARIATTTGGSARLELYNHISGFNGALEFRATSWENDALVISGGTPNTTKFLVSRDPNAATLQVTGESYFTGNVGIGTTAPTEKLEVVGYAKASTGFKFGNYGLVYEAANDVNIKNAAYYHINFHTNNAQRMRITNAGNVGIGTTAPSHLLSVNNKFMVTSTGSAFIPAGQGIGIDPYSGGANTNIYFNTGNVQVSGVTDFIHNNASFIVKNTGNVGIGITAPALQSAGTGLHINAPTSSEIKFTNSTTGTTASDGTALVSNGVGFTINNRESGSLSLGTNNSTRLYIDSAGKVGIGTTAPAQVLHINKDNPYIQIQDSSAPTRGDMSAGIIMKDSTGAQSFQITQSNSVDVSIRANAGDLSLGTFVGTVIKLDGSKVGIGNTAPDEKLRVEGNIKSAGDFIGSAVKLGFAGTANITTYDTNEDLLINPNGSGNILMQTTSGNVGIGTTAPAAKLDVAGTIKLDDGGGSVYVGNAAGYNDDKTFNYNVGIGDNALAANTGGNNNIAVGSYALYNPTNTSGNIAIGGSALGDTTTGYRNTAVGHLAHSLNTSGYENVAIGHNALGSATSPYQSVAVGSYALGNANGVASDNTGIGYYAMSLLTTGRYNTSLGTYALSDTVLGSNNTAVGYYAGGGDYQGTNSVYLGMNTAPNSDNETNQVVIGYGATGNGSNSVTIGNTSITKTIMREGVGVGVTSPASSMHIGGAAMRQLRINTPGGPTSSADTAGNIGDIAYDDLYFYIKTTNGWGRVPLDFGF